MAFTALLVDDESTILTTLKGVFETREFIVSTALSAADAVRMLDRSSFDLVVTDMRMEAETSGFEVVRRARSASNRPVVIILSAYPIPASEWRNAGVDAMFMKGGGIVRILDDIERLLRSRAKQPAAR